MGKRWKLIRAMLKNEGYTTTDSTLDVSIQSIDPDGLIHWTDAEGTTHESYYDGVNPVVVNYFDITADWAENSVTDQSTFESFLTTAGLENIVIDNFSLVGNDLTCNLDADVIKDIKGNYRVNFTHSYITNVSYIGSLALITHLHLDSNSIVTFDPSIALPSSLTTLHLYSNSIATFNPTIALPDSLTELSLNSNSMTTQGYTDSVPWAEAMTEIPDRGTIRFTNNTNSVSGTTLETTLISKGWTVLV